MGEQRVRVSTWHAPPLCGMREGGCMCGRRADVCVCALFGLRGGEVQLMVARGGNTCAIGEERGGWGVREVRVCMRGQLRAACGCACGSFDSFVSGDGGWRCGEGGEGVCCACMVGAFAVHAQLAEAMAWRACESSGSSMSGESGVCARSASLTVCVRDRSISVCMRSWHVLSACAPGRALAPW